MFKSIKDGETIWQNGDRTWFRTGLCHRDNDLPAIIRAHGTKAWWKDGRLHRENKPAIEYIDGSKDWYKHGGLYRRTGLNIDGPCGITGKEEDND